MKKFFNMTVGFKHGVDEDAAGFLVEADNFVEAAIKAQDFVDELDAALRKKYGGRWREGDAYLQTVYCGQGEVLATTEAIEEFVRTVEYEFD